MKITRALFNQTDRFHVGRVDQILDATISNVRRHAIWACRHLSTAEMTDGAGPRNCHLHLAGSPGLGPDQRAPGAPVALYET